MMLYGTYIYDVIPFLTTNSLWTVREVKVDRVCNTTYIANKISPPTEFCGILDIFTDGAALVEYIRRLMSPDDWLDAVFLTGGYIRNILESKQMDQVITLDAEDIQEYESLVRDEIRPTLASKNQSVNIWSIQQLFTPNADNTAGQYLGAIMALDVVDADGRPVAKPQWAWVTAEWAWQLSPTIPEINRLAVLSTKRNIFHVKPYYPARGKTWHQNYPYKLELPKAE
jgi:hypothetical protein